MDRQLLIKFLEGKCSPHEYHRVKDWSTSRYYRSDLENLLQEIWDEIPKEYEEVDPDHLYQTIMNKAQATDAFIDDNSPGVRWLPYAAAVSFLVLMAWGLWHWVVPGPTATSDNSVVLAAEKGQKKTFFLSDGSKVMLNSNSSIWFDNNFTDTSRVIELQGEGFFDIAEDPQRPFTVLSGDLRTTALGTEFIVNARKHIEIVLTEGKVSIVNTRGNAGSGVELILKPGEKVIYDPEGNYFESEDFDKQTELAWTQGVLYFNNESFQEIIYELEQWYDVDVTVIGIGDERYSGSFKNESLENVLKGMGFTLGFNYHIDGKSVTLTGYKK